MQTMIELGQIAKPIIFWMMTAGSLLALPVILRIDKKR